MRIIHAVILQTLKALHNKLRQKAISEKGFKRDDFSFALDSTKTMNIFSAITQQIVLHPKCTQTG